MSERLLVVGNLAKDLVGGKEMFGGSAANLSVGAKRLGVDVDIMSVLGQDSFSSAYKIFLRDNDIGISLVFDKLDELPVCEVISKQNTILNSVWIDNGCHPAMDTLQIPLSDMRKYSLVHLVSCPPALAKNISSTKLPLSFEPGPMLVSDPAYFDVDVAKSSTLIFMNEEEYMSVKHYMNLYLFDRGEYPRLEALVVTLGVSGVQLYKKTDKGFVKILIFPKNPHVEIVDPTGAGDNFKAGFLCGYMRGKSLEESVEIGAEMGAASVMQYGGILPESVIDRIRQKFGL